MSAPPKTHVHSPELVTTLYRKMALARRFEEKCGQAYGQKKINGFCHLYIGQEAVAVGINEALRPDDPVMTAYRDHVHPLIRGAHPGMLMAELFGRDAGYSQGKGGSMHLFDVEHAFYGGYGIVGGQIPLAAGMAFAARYRGEDRVVVCSFGDAAFNQGALHETFNMAAKWKLPVLYVVENNKYGMGTDVSRVTAEPELHKRAIGYRMRSEAVDGMDVLQVYDLVRELAGWIRSGNGPVLLEANTYRFRGHSMSDSATYRTKDEVEREKSKDPILTLRAHITKAKAGTDASLDAIDEEVKKIVDDAIAFADASPEPAPETVWLHTEVADGEADVHPRERVLGATDVKWPQFPDRFEVKWDLEPRPADHPQVPAATPVSKKGAA